jgi:hypothetical protein
MAFGISLPPKIVATWFDERVGKANSEDGMRVLSVP